MRKINGHKDDMKARNMSRIGRLEELNEDLVRQCQRLTYFVRLLVLAWLFTVALLVASFLYH